MAVSSAPLPAQPDRKENNSPSFRSRAEPAAFKMTRSKPSGLLPALARNLPPLHPAPAPAPAPRPAPPPSAASSAPAPPPPATPVYPTRSAHQEKGARDHRGSGDAAAGGRAVLLLVKVPMAEPGARRAPRGVAPRQLESAAASAQPHPPPLPSRSPSTSNTPCALRQPDGRTQEGGGERGPGRLAPAQLRWAVRTGRSSRCCNSHLPVLSSGQRLRENKEEGWARENEGTTSIAKPPGRCQPPSSAALTGRRGTESWWPPSAGKHVVAPKGESAPCDVIAKEAGLFVRAELRRRSRASKEVQMPCRSLKNLQLLSDPRKTL